MKLLDWINYSTLRPLNSTELNSVISGELGMICAELIYAIHLISTFVEEFNCAIVQIAQQLILEIK